MYGNIHSRSIVGFLVLLVSLSQFGCQTNDASNEDDALPMAGQGIMTGEVTDSTALVQVRLTATDELVDGDVPGMEGVVEFTVSKSGATGPVGEPQSVVAEASHDYIARAAFDRLEPGTEYICTTRLGRSQDKLHEGPTAHFRTLYGSDQAAEVSFVVVTGMNYAKFHGDERIDRAIHKLHNNTDLPAPYAGPDKDQGYPALVSILELKPNFIVGTGDNVYYDTPKEPRAETPTEMRQKWHEQFVQPRYRDLFAKVPTYWEVDDHDYRIDDSDNTGDYDPSPETALRILLEQLPYGPADDDGIKTYRTHRVSQDLQIWLLENRLYRSPNAQEDGPEKTIWGAEQKAWLKQTLSDSDATFKLIISPNPMIGPDDARKTDNHTNIGGFQHERDEFFNWLRESGLVDENVFILCGDRHWQYHSVHPLGVEEFSCGALVDANSRPGRKPGDAASTDPDGLITQEYSQQEPSGGFLHVRSVPATNDGPATLTFDFMDERGEMLHRHEKKSDK